MRNLRIRQLLLLLLRIAIILLIVLSFARPTLKSGSGGLLTERSPSEAVVILDNSLSLNEARLTGSLLEKMRQAFSSLETAFQTGDRITVLQATIPQRVLISQENYQTNLWERVLQKTQPNYLKSDLDNAILYALNMLEKSVYATQEVYVISDFQTSAIKNNGSAFAAMLERPEFQRVKLFSVPIIHENFENISVDSVEVVNRLIEINQPIRIKAFFRNHHPDKHLNTLTSVVLNENRVSQQKVSIPPGQIREVEYRLTLTDNGFIQGRIETEGDALQEDNRRYFNFYVPEKIRTLHIMPDDQFKSFIPLIVQPAQSQGIFEFESEVLANWTSRNFTEYDMVILEGLNQLPETLTRRLKHFMDFGGGALIIPGDQIVPPQYQNLFQNFSMGDLVERRGEPGNTDQFLTLKDVQWDHPIFEGLFEEKQQLNPIETYAGYRIKTAQNADNLIQLSDRSPLLIQAALSKGTSFFLTAPLLPAWSQLPTKGFVVPLVYRIIYYAGTRKILDRQEVLNGNLFQQEFTNLEAPFDFQVASSRSAEVKLNPRFRGSTVFLEFRDTELPGNYQLRHNGEPISIISVNPWKEESEMRFFSTSDIEAALPRAHVFKGTENIAEQVQKSRFGKELWKYFLIIAFILLLVEMALARTGSKKEFAESVKAESL